MEIVDRAFSGSRALRTVGVACLLLLNCANAGDIRPPAPPFTDRPWGVTSSSAPATALHLGAFQVKLETTTLADVRTEAGGGDIRHQDDAGGSFYWRCYTIGETDRVWIESDDDFGGPEHRVTSVTAERHARARANAECPALPPRLTPVRTDRGIWLGITEAEVRQRLGTPSHSEGAWHSYDFEGKAPGSCEPNGFDVKNWLWYKSEDGRITTIWLNQLTTC